MNEEERERERKLNLKVIPHSAKEELLSGSSLSWGKYWKYWKRQNTREGRRLKAEVPNMLKWIIKWLYSDVKLLKYSNYLGQSTHSGLTFLASSRGKFYYKPNLYLSRGYNYNSKLSHCPQNKIWFQTQSTWSCFSVKSVEDNIFKC